MIAIVGDNLGSHSLGGFTENFSRSKHFCRYCLIDRESLEREPTKLGPLRTKETYANCVEELSKGQEVTIAGVKFDSIFNQLKHFHVCQPGLPPCLGHDLFEGIVSADLALYIKNLVSVGKHFSYVQLYRSISQLKLQGSDTSSRPCEVKSDGERLVGSAAQNWCLLRLLSVLVGNRIKNPLEDKAWQLCLKLREIVELICAPKIHVNQVAYLKIIIREYLQSRVALFPDTLIKPKHHFLLHYPDLILKFGPLIRLWTLRFESKHTYFKQCARKLHNFKNLGVTLAERHQLLQAYLHSGNIFPSILQVGQANEFDAQMYNAAIQEAVRFRGLTKDNTIETSTVTYKGTLYKKGMSVVLDVNDSGYVLGKIVLILVKQDKVYFVSDKHQSVPVLDLGVHCLQYDLETQYVCVCADSLADYYPLPVYRKFDLDLAVLHRSVCLGEK